MYVTDIMGREEVAWDLWPQPEVGPVYSADARVG